MLALLAVFLGLTGWNVARLAGRGEDRVPQMPPVLGRAAVYLAVERIEEHRQSTGALPINLEELDLPLQGLTYTLGKTDTSCGRCSTPLR